MASVLPSVIDESLFQCRLCCRSASDPRLLPCLHVFCRTCLLRHVARLHAAAAAQHQNTVAQNGPEDRTSPKPEVPSSTAVSQKDPESLPTGSVGQPSVALPPALPAKNPFVVGHDDDHYEIPQDYEDVDGGQNTYANGVMVSAGHLVQTEHGYAVMTSKPSTSATSSSAQVWQLCTERELMTTVVIVTATIGRFVSCILCESDIDYILQHLRNSNPSYLCRMEARNAGLKQGYDTVADKKAIRLKLLPEF